MPSGPSRADSAFSMVWLEMKAPGQIVPSRGVIGGWVGSIRLRTLWPLLEELLRYRAFVTLQSLAKTGDEVGGRLHDSAAAGEVDRVRGTVGDRVVGAVHQQNAVLAARTLIGESPRWK